MNEWRLHFYNFYNGLLQPRNERGWEQCKHTHMCLHIWCISIRRFRSVYFAHYSPLLWRFNVAHIPVSHGDFPALKHVRASNLILFPSLDTCGIWWWRLIININHKIATSYFVECIRKRKFKCVLIIYYHAIDVTCQQNTQLKNTEALQAKLQQTNGKPLSATKTEGHKSCVFDN